MPPARSSSPAMPCGSWCGATRGNRAYATGNARSGRSAASGRGASPKGMRREEGDHAGDCGDAPGTAALPHGYGSGRAHTQAGGACGTGADAMGGDILFIEAAAYPAGTHHDGATRPRHAGIGSGRHDLVRSCATKYRIDLFKTSDIHIHVYLVKAMDEVAAL